MKQVLIVDEDAFIAALVLKRLTGECSVMRAHSADAAIDVLRCGERFDIILCRRHLGGQHGGQAFWERMKVECPEQARKVVLFNAMPVAAPPPGPRMWS